MEPAITDLLYESFWLLVIGMAVVFSFLTMLIGGVKLIEKFCAAFPEQEPPNKHTPSQSFSQPLSQSHIQPLSQNQGVPPQVVAAITAAIHRHRQK